MDKTAKRVQRVKSQNTQIEALCAALSTRRQASTLLALPLSYSSGYRLRFDVVVAVAVLVVLDANDDFVAYVAVLVDIDTKKKVVGIGSNSLDCAKLT